MRTPSGLRASAGLLLTALLTTKTGAYAETPSTVGGDALSTPGYVVSAGQQPLPPTVAAGWLVADLDTGDILAAKDPHGRFAPASTLKTLTAETVIPQISPKTIITPTFDAVNVDGTKVGLVPGLTYTVREVFTAMLVMSANDAANTVADVNGGIAHTVEQMNAEALRLQALDTHAVNANGLDAAGQLTSPYDLGLIARAAMQEPDFRTYVGTKHSSIRGKGTSRIAISSHDKLLYNYPGAIGIKNGYTVAAKASFVGAATRNGHTLLVVLMRTAPRYWPEAASLLDWGFGATAAGAVPVGKLVDPLPRPGETSEPIAAPVRQSTAKLPHLSKDSGLPLLPLSIVGAGVGVLGVGLRRGRRRRPKKMALPKL